MRLLCRFRLYVRVESRRYGTLRARLFVALIKSTIRPEKSRAHWEQRISHKYVCQRDVRTSCKWYGRDFFHYTYFNIYFAIFLFSFFDNTARFRISISTIIALREPANSGKGRCYLPRTLGHRTYVNEICKTWKQRDKKKIFFSYCWIFRINLTSLAFPWDKYR